MSVVDRLSYVHWTVFALVCYSLVAPMIKVGMTVVPSAVAVLIANAILTVVVVGFIRYEGESVLPYLRHPRARYVHLTGLLLGVGVLAYYHALSLGPVSVVVPIYGLFIVVSSIVGVALFDEPLTRRKLLGLGLAVAAIYLTST